MTSGSLPPNPHSTNVLEYLEIACQVVYPGHLN